MATRARILADYVSSGDELALKAPIAGPTFTGTVAIPNVANLETAVVANTAKVSFTPDAAQVFNDTGNDVDFRIESDDNANMFFVDGGEDRVGIGEGSPDELLHLKGASGGHTILRMESPTGSNLNNYIQFKTQSDTKSWAIAARSDDDGNKLDIGSNTTPNILVLKPEGNVGIGTATPTDELQVHDQGGNCGMHISSHTGSADIKLSAGTDGGVDTAGLIYYQGSTFKWDLTLLSNNNLRVYDGGDGSVAVSMSSGATSWAANSDERMKKDIVDMEDRLEDLLKIKVRRFKWKHSDKDDIGFIAQEVVSQVPEAVTIGDDEVWSAEEADGRTTFEGDLKNPYAMSKERLVPMMVKSIQELSAKNDALEVENTALKTRMDALEARVTALEG